MEFNRLPDLLNTGFEFVEIGLFYGGEHWERKYADSWLVLTRSLQDGDSVLS